MALASSREMTLALELLVLLRDLLHLRLDFLEVVRGDPVLHFEVVVETALDRRAVGELGVRPDAQDGGGHDVGAGVAQAFQIGHLLALFESLPFGDMGRRMKHPTARFSRQTRHPSGGSGRGSESPRSCSKRRKIGRDWRIADGRPPLSPGPGGFRFFVDHARDFGPIPSNRKKIAATTNAMVPGRFVGSSQSHCDRRSENDEAHAGSERRRR
ncbi:MAG: hypothetical protein QM755_09715 [Luteolibacter sp.]